MKTLKAVFVDDNKDICESMRVICRTKHIDSETAYSGKAAIERIKALHPDFVLLDIGMPDLSGWQVAEILRQDETLKGMKIYALTAYASPGDIQRSFDAGMDWHFIKPLELDSFWEVLQKHGLLNGTNGVK